jgi:2-keto-3-deoxy-L-rhamnonate aldolase RhmA
VEEENLDHLENLARDRLVSGELSIGIAVRFARTVDIAPAMRAAGYDWLFIDLEHGSMPLDTVAQISSAAISCGISSLVRVPKGEYSLATRALDVGASGIVLPHVDSAEEAREAVSRLKLPPLGQRSLGAAPQLKYRPTALPEMIRLLNDSVLCVIMLETPQAIEKADAIAAVEGVDVIMIGTNDLCAEMGIPGRYDDSRVVLAYETVLAACRKHGKWPGMGGVYDEMIAPRYIEMGFRFVLSGLDFNLMMAGATARAKFLRARQ